MLKKSLSLTFFLSIFALTSNTLQSQSLFKDIWPGFNDGFPYYLATNDDLLFFRANSAANGTELWVCDGTSAGTTLLKDIYPGATNSNPTELIELNGKIIFSADHPTYGKELWISDGTSGGTVLLKDIWPGANFTDGSPNSFKKFGNKVVFSAQISSNQWEPMITDGTTAGTKLLKDIYAGFAGSIDGLWNKFYEHNGELYFSATSANIGHELWKTDGTTNGTVLVKDLNPGSNSGLFKEDQMISFNNHLYFVGYDANNFGKELYKTDGTAAGTVLVKDIYTGVGSSSIRDFAVVGNKLFFSADDGVNGSELWCTDGTSAGTQLVKDIYTGTGNSSPIHLTELNGLLFFTANEVNLGSDLWVSDGTTAGTKLFYDFNPAGSSDVNEYYKYAGLLFVSANNPNTVGRETWIVNGDSASTVLLGDLYPGTPNSYSKLFTPFKEKLFFTAVTPNEGNELWSYDPCIGSGISKNVTISSDSLISLDNANSYQWYYCGGSTSIKLDGETDSIFMAKLSGKYQVELTVTGCIKRSNCTYLENKPPIDLVNDTFYTDTIVGAKYQWYDCKNQSLVTGATSLHFSPSVSGEYAVIVSLNGIIDTSACKVFEVLPDGINSHTKNNVSVFPNPAKQFLIVKIDDLKGAGSIRLFDMRGRTYISSPIIENETHINLEAIENGLYFMEISINGDVITKKIIINHQ